MAVYHNLMEDILEMEYDAIKESLECCTCEQCRNDVIAYALNHTQPRYVVNPDGTVMSKIETYRLQGVTDVWAALTRAAIIVNESPRH